MKSMFTAVLFICMGIALSCNKTQEEEAFPGSVQELVSFPINDPAAKVITLQQNVASRLHQELEVPASVLHYEQFKQQELPPQKIDILIVIDNSGSMEEEQRNLASKLSALISQLTYIDWQVNVITTDYSCPRLSELPIRPDTPSRDTLFRDAVNAGIFGSGYEQGLQFTMGHIYGACSSASPWLREDTNLAVLIVSDEDEWQFSRYAVNLEQFYLDLEAKEYFIGDNIKFYGIIGHPDMPTCETVYGIAYKYAEVIKRSSGVWGSICDRDYSATLREISSDIRLSLKMEFPLREKPLITTIIVDLDGVIFDGQWTIVDQRLVIDGALPPGSTLTVSYQTESFRLIELGTASSEYLLESITLKGETLNPSRYRYDPIKNTVLLLFDPEPGEIISTTLKGTNNLLASFPFPDTVNVKDISCFIDNELFNTDIEIKDGEIFLHPTIPEGKVAHCLYRKS